MITASNPLPEAGFIKLWQIVGNKKSSIPAIIPVSRTTFLNKVKSGEYPQPVKLGVRSIAWRVEDIRALIEQLGA
jgi:predicted DNA-binding transcriptional regulator AlpA